MRRKAAKFWWLAVAGLCLALYAVPIARNGDPRAIVAGVPLGSRLSELDGYLGKIYERSTVEAWSNTPTGTRSTAWMKSKHGFEYVRSIGAYDTWRASKATRDAFTGRIEFFHYSSVIPDELAPSYVVTLVYLNGLLKKKEFGYLPG